MNVSLSMKNKDVKWVPEIQRASQNIMSNEIITILSTSSKRITGFFTPTVFKAFKILPGIDPIYVRLELINQSQPC